MIKEIQQDEISECVKVIRENRRIQPPVEPNRQTPCHGYCKAAETQVIIK